MEGPVGGRPSGFSGFVGTWVVQMNKLYGWDYFEQLATLKPHVGRSIIDTVTVLLSGERSVGASPIRAGSTQRGAGQSDRGVLSRGGIGADDLGFGQS